MIDLHQRLDELSALGPARRMRAVSGPQGPRVVLEGRSVLNLCSDDCLGLAGHPRAREGAADAALRWGAGAGASRLAAGTMSPHRLLEEALAAFHGTDSALLFGSGCEAYSGVIPALAGRGDIVFSDALNHTASIDGCRLTGAELFVYDHCDVEHLEWGLRRAGGRGALIVTEGVFGLDGDVAPLAEIARLAGSFGVRLLVDEAHGIGAVGPGGRGAVAEAGVEDEVDVLVGSLGSALGTSGAYVACGDLMTRYLVSTVASLGWSTAPAPPVAAGALAALELILEQPRRVDKLEANADALREAMSREGFETVGSATHIVSVVVGPGDLASRVADLAIEGGVFGRATGSPEVARLRLAVMASHTQPELREAAQVLGRAALLAGFRPGSGLPLAVAQSSGMSLTAWVAQAA